MEIEDLEKIIKDCEIKIKESNHYMKNYVDSIAYYSVRIKDYRNDIQKSETIIKLSNAEKKRLEKRREALQDKLYKEDEDEDDSEHGKN